MYFKQFIRPVWNQDKLIIWDKRNLKETLLLKESKAPQGKKKKKKEWKKEYNIKAVQFLLFTETRNKFDWKECNLQRLESSNPKHIWGTSMTYLNYPDASEKSLTDFRKAFD